MRMLRRLVREERGAVMVLASVTMTILLLFAGLALDFGRAHLLKAQLQTAVDAGALAGALQVVPKVELEIDRWVIVDEWCTDPITRQPYLCSYWETASPARVYGTEWELIFQNRWLEAAGAQCYWPYRCDSVYRIVREELHMPPSTTPVAESTFYKNAVWPSGSHGARLTGPPAVQVNHAKAEVTVTAGLTTPTPFLKLVGIRELRVTRTGSAVPVRR